MYAGLEWYALEVAWRKEKQVASAIADKGYQCFLPQHKVQTLWSDRIRISSVPLFGGYVFCRFDARYRMPVVITPGVRDIVSTARVPTPIPAGELEVIQKALENGLRLEPCDRLKEGDRVLVVGGPLAGVEGAFLRHRGGDRLILSVSLIQRAVAVEIDRMYVQPISTRPLVEPATPQIAQRGCGSTL